MRARVIETGKIVDVVANGNYYDTTDNKERYYSHELDFNDTVDYWTRLEHQAAIAAMKELLPMVNDGYEYVYEETAIVAYNYAHALVEKLKEKEERK